MKRTWIKHLLALLLIYAFANTEAYKPEQIPPSSRFVVLGDMPYNLDEKAMLTGPDGSLFKAIHSSEADWLIHIGDIKAGGRACSDQRLLASRDQIKALLPKRVAYTPGDNEWTDCDRFGQYELERLAFIRKHFTGQTSGVHPITTSLVQQNGTPENIRWEQGDIGFINAHIPGSNFGRNEILSGHGPTVIAYAVEREKQLSEWLDLSFEAFHHKRAIILSFHADIFTLAGKPRPSCTAEKPDRCDGYKPIRKQLKSLVKHFNKPVLLVHGDTQDTCLQHVKTDEQLPVWRLNAAGDGIPDALLVSVSLDKLVPFYAELIIRESGLPNRCYVNARL